MLNTITNRLLFGLNWVAIGPLALASERLPTGKANPEFDPSHERINKAWRAMRASPKPLDRPVLVLSGYKSWPNMAMSLRHELTNLTSGRPSDFLSAAYTFRGDIDSAVSMAIDRVEALRPSDDPGWTREFDVVGISMGGLVARRAAMDRGGGARRLRIRRLFTLASPHMGARLAARVAPDRAAKCMRPGSSFLRELDAAWAEAPIEIYPYAVLNDGLVGAKQTAPPGSRPLWTRGSAVLSHFTVSANRRIVSDIALRLRGEAPLAGAGSDPPSD